MVSGATASFEPVSGEAGGASAVAEEMEGPVLVVRKGPQPGERFYLDAPALSMGRDPSSDIFLNDMTVSRSHANLEVVGGQVTVRDAGSLNGTYVNGVCTGEADLSDGDILQIGTFQMVYHQGKVVR
jgi:pSer/pThr/pTyr-binding forkhead associated (FHA) protein